MFSSVTTAKIARMEMTALTSSDCTRATADEPMMFSAVIARMIRQANTFAHVALSPATTALA